MSATSGMIQTVLGPIEPSRLGYTHTHEHLLSDLSATLTPQGMQALFPDPADSPPQTGPQELPASVRGRLGEPVRLDNYDWIRRNVLNWDNLRLLHEGDAVEELAHYRSAGGASVVDSTPIGLARDASGLARISRATGVNVVMGSGYYVRDYHPAGLAARSVAEIAERIVADVAEGVDGTGIRAGIIGEIGTGWPIHPTEERVLRAACVAQAATGAALQIHPGRNVAAPLEAMRIVESAGGDPTRVVVAHIDRTLTRLEDMLRLAETGCYLEFDLFGQESSYYAMGDVDRMNDATRIDFLTSLAEAGYGHRVVVAQDICQKVYLRKYGGPGYAHILENVVPVMRRKGWTADDLSRVTHHNPAELLALA